MPKILSTWFVHAPLDKLFGTPLPCLQGCKLINPKFPLSRKMEIMLHRNIFQISKKFLKAFEIADLLPHYKLRPDFSKLIVILGCLNFPLGLYVRRPCTM